MIFWRGYDILNSEYTKVANIQNSVAAVPVALSCLIMSLNFMPETLTALEGIPVFGSAVSAIDFRRWGFGRGDSEIRVEYPETGDDDADALTEKYLDECREKFFWYFERKYNGYTGADFTSEIERDDERMLVVSMYCTINAGSSLTYQRFFTVDKATGEIVGLSDLFSAEDYNAVLSAEIKRQIEYRTESGDSYYGYGIFTSPEDMENAFDSPHRTYIVNMNYVSGVQGYELIVADTVMPISKSAYRKFKENYIRYCFEK